VRLERCGQRGLFTDYEHKYPPDRGFGSEDDEDEDEDEEPIPNRP
jgi:hypothetical protein